MGVDIHVLRLHHLVEDELDKAYLESHIVEFEGWKKIF